MICNADIAELWALQDPYMAVQVVKHDYKTKHHIKYLGQPNADYPKKNQSSLILWNCASYLNRKLTPDVVSKMSGADLHRFTWLPDDRVGELPKDWNWLSNEYPDNDHAKLIHYTIGTPCFPDYKHSPMAQFWHSTHRRMNEPTL